jgi:pentatricopeptide repeat protein
MNLRKVLIPASLLAVTLFTPIASSGKAEIPDLRALKEKAHSLVQQGNVQEAEVLGRQIVEKAPDDWQARAALSYFEWQTGNVFDSIGEAEQAIRLAPNEVRLLIYLAQIKECLDDNKGAIPLYEKALKLAPSNPVPWLGLARSYVKDGRVDHALSLMEEMGGQNFESFEWYHELVDTYLRMNKSANAVALSPKVLAAAHSEQERSEANAQLLLSLLREKNIKQAKSMKCAVLENSTVKDAETFVRAAVQLVPPADPAQATKLFDQAKHNLTAEQDGDGFFRLGRAFEQKASLVSYDSTKYDQWIKLAYSAYSRAAELDKVQAAWHPKYSLAMASMQDQLNKHDEATASLKTASDLDKLNKLPTFLLSQVDESTSAKTVIKPINLAKATILVEGLNCNCQLTRVEEAVRNTPGVVYASIPATKVPYTGTILVDPTKGSIDGALAEARAKSIAFFATMKAPVVPNFRIVSTATLHKASDAISVTQNSIMDNPVEFYNSFKAILPTMPVGELAAAPKPNM